jgi:hypothetical protein
MRQMRLITPLGRVLAGIVVLALVALLLRPAAVQVGGIVALFVVALVTFTPKAGAARLMVAPGGPATPGPEPEYFGHDDPPPEDIRWGTQAAIQREQMRPR